MFLRDFARHTATPVNTPVSTPAFDPLMTGLTAATLVETAGGWCPAQTLRVGDAVQTLDGGAARIVALDRATLPLGTALVHLPGGVLDTCSDLLLLPGQPVLVDTFGATDAPFVLLSARALLALPGVSLRKSPRRIEVTRPIFACEEAIWANSGALIHCAGPTDTASFFPRPTAAELRAILSLRGQWAA